ncbi:hypothetical protein ACFE04_015440 [Oxalis oulophora]
MVGSINRTTNINVSSQANSCQNKLEAVSVSHRNLRDGICLLLSRWNGLQMAVENQWGGHDSLQKYQQFAADIFSWFSQSKALPSIEDLENLLHESMLLSFNTDIEDGSIEEFMRFLNMEHDMS